MRKWLFRALLLFLLYVLLGILLPPLFQKTAGAAQQAADAGKQAAAKERVLNIENNHEALLWRLRVIESAEESLVLTTFDFGDDTSGRDIMAALVAAADRGVEVRILIDGINGMLKMSGSKYFQTMAAHEHIEARFYNPVNLLMPWTLNYRMHDKYLIADDAIYMLGGRNTNDLFLSDTEEKRNIDRDILVVPEPAEANNAQRSIIQLQAYFDAVWNQPCCKPQKGRFDALTAETLTARYVHLQTLYPEAFAPVDWQAVTMEADSIRLLHNGVHARKKEPLLLNKLYEQMQQGEALVIETPYIICNAHMYETLEKLTADGKELKLIINAVEAGANPFGCVDYLNEKKRILKTGTEVYEALVGKSLHRKAVLVDDDISLVGSYNLDMRSTYLDTETMLLIESEELNAALRAVTEQTMAQSRHVLPDGTEIPGAAFEAVDPGMFKHALYGVLRFLVKPFRYLL